MRKSISSTAKHVTALIPAYNEERFIGSMVIKVLGFVNHVIVVDDGSSDATGAIAKAAGARVIRHAGNLGKSQALNTGFAACRKMGTQAVVVLDADCQHNPEEIPFMLAPILNGQADMTIGSRYLDKRSRVPWDRIIGHRLTTRLTNLASGTRLTDSQNGFRAFAAHTLPGLVFTSRGFNVESEMQFLARENNLRLQEVPVTVRYTDRPKRSVIGHGLNVLNGILNLIGLHRPLLFFGIPGILLTLIGLSWGLWVIQIYRASQVLAVGYSLISVSMVILGSLSMFAGIILHAIRGQLNEIRASLR